MELGVDTFVETTPDVQTGKTISHAERLREVVEEIVLADQVGLDIFGVGEHHRKEFAGSATVVVLAAAASMTKRIRLTSSVTVLSAVDPVRLFQQFATLDGISKEDILERKASTCPYKSGCVSASSSKPFTRLARQWG